MAQLLSAYTVTELRQMSVVRLKELCDRHGRDYSGFIRKRWKQEYIDALLTVTVDEIANDIQDVGLPNAEGMCMF